MPGCRFRLVIVSAAISLLYAPSLFSAEMLRLTESGDFKPLSEYEQKVAQVKKLVEDGECEAAKEAYEQLKKDFPQALGLDAGDPRSLRAFDDFVEAEMYLCKRKFATAVKSYRQFLYRYPHKRQFAEVALDRQLYIARRFLAGERRKLLLFFKIKRYGEARRIIERIIDRETMDSPIGLAAAKTMAESYEERRKFEDAYDWWFRIHDAAFNSWYNIGLQLTPENRGMDRLAREELLVRQAEASLRRIDALLPMARCQHAAYREPKYDTSALEVARRHYKEFIEYFRQLLDSGKVNSDKIIKQLRENVQKLNRSQEIDVERIIDVINDQLAKINEQLAYKQFCIGRYYEDTGNNLAANAYYRMIKDVYDVNEGTLEKWQQIHSQKR